MKKKHIFIFCLSLGLIVPGAIVWTIFNGFMGRSKLLSHHKFTMGRVYGCRKGVKGSPRACNVRYRYTEDGKQYEFATLFQPSQLTCEDCTEHLIGHDFPVVFETGNTENSVLLLTPGDCKLFEYSFPDSLKWVQQYAHDR